MPNEQGNESSVRQDGGGSDAGSARRDRERGRVRELKQPHWLLKSISAVLAPLGVPWAKKIQEEVARAEEAALQAGRTKVDEVSGRGP